MERVVSDVSRDGGLLDLETEALRSFDTSGNIDTLSLRRGLECVYVCMCFFLYIFYWHAPLH